MIAQIQGSGGFDEIPQLPRASMILRMVQQDLQSLFFLPLDGIHPVAQLLKLLPSPFFRFPANALLHDKLAREWDRGDDLIQLAFNPLDLAVFP